MEWIKHFPTEVGRSIRSDVPIEAKLRSGGRVFNYAGNFDNWQWRERSPGSIAEWRPLTVSEAETLAAIFKGLANNLGVTATDAELGPGRNT